MISAEKLKLLQDDVDVFATATVETPLTSLPDWGSLATLLVIVHIEERHKLAVTGAQIRGCGTVGDLLALIP